MMLVRLLDSTWGSVRLWFGYVRFLGAQLDERMDGSEKSCERRSNLDAPCRGPEVASLRIVACIICMSVSTYCPRIYVPISIGQAGLIIMHMRVSSPLVSL